MLERLSIEEADLDDNVITVWEHSLLASKSLVYLKIGRAFARGLRTRSDGTRSQLKELRVCEIKSMKRKLIRLLDR